MTEAIRILATRAVSRVSLDHDISHCINMDNMVGPFPCGETFEPVAWFIAEKWAQYSGTYHPLPKIMLHTANPVGAKKMAKILADAGIKSTMERIA